MTRKKPYRHPVRQYKRSDGTKVKEYVRGEGQKPSKRVKARSSGFSGFQVVFYYDSDSQRIDVNAPSLPEAAHEGLRRYTVGKIPRAMRIRRRNRK